jgi:TRAP-type C4-dicarboxylate transport system permease small subunit
MTLFAGQLRSAGVSDEIAQRLTRASANAAALLLLGTVISNAVAVLFRYGIGQPLVWTEEVQRYLMVWVAYLGSAACVGSADHMAVDLLTVWLPPSVQRILRVGLLGLSLVFCAVLVWKGIPLALGNAAQLSPAARIPMIYPYLAVGVGGGLMLSIGALRLRAELRRPDKEPTPP